MTSNHGSARVLPHLERTRRGEIPRERTRPDQIDSPRSHNPGFPVADSTEHGFPFHAASDRPGDAGGKTVPAMDAFRQYSSLRLAISQ